MCWFVIMTSPEEKDPFSALYLYIYHRIGIVCPELIRVEMLDWC